MSLIDSYHAISTKVQSQIAPKIISVWIPSHHEKCDSVMPVEISIAAEVIRNHP